MQGARFVLRAQLRAFNLIHDAKTTNNARDAVHAKYHGKTEKALFDQLWAAAVPSSPKTIELNHAMIDRIDQEVGRLFLGANRFVGLPLRSNVFFSRSRQDIGSDAIKTVSDVTEISAEQVYRLRRFIDLRYGYGLGRNQTTREDPSSPFDLTVRVARLTTSGLVDRRNDPFDPVRGWFSSANVELSRPGARLTVIRMVPTPGIMLVSVNCANGRQARVSWCDT